MIGLFLVTFIQRPEVDCYVVWTITGYDKTVIKLMDEEEFILRKRLPPFMPKRRNDFYITRRTDFKAQISRCQKYLDNGGQELYIHGLGAAINRAMNLALQLQNNGMGTIGVAVRTSTVELTDDLEPVNSTVSNEFQTRHNSAIHIKIFRINPLTTLNENTVVKSI